ncbi:MAG: hypothetical protein K2Z81_01585, partial [Cyanobacteria bacterium]|nr:hypothetical protein [Cyanobacteriota bacterium]
PDGKKLLKQRSRLSSGEYPANPCSKSRPGIILGDITCESELMFKRLDRPRGFPDRSGQVSYSFDRFRGYAIVGYDKDGMEISTAQGAVEVLSNTWSSDVIFYKGLPVNDAVVYELMKYVERAVIIFKKRHGRLPKKASEIREILPTHLKEKFEQLNVSLSEGEFGIDDAMPIVMQRNTIQYFSPNEGVYGVYAIRGAGANGKPLVHLDRVIVLPETLGLSSM